MDAEIQTFVKAGGAKTVAMEVSLDAKVRDVARVLRSRSEDDQDMYVVSDGRVFKGNEEGEVLESGTGTEKPAVCRDTSHERHRLVEKAHSSSFSECTVDKTWSSQEWKSVELMDDRTERHVVCPQRGAPQHCVIEDEEAESDLSLGSRSFLQRVNDRVRK